jgi:hypothetical protein
MYLLTSKNENNLLILKLTNLFNDFVVFAFCWKAFEYLVAAWRSAISADPLDGYPPFVTLRAS